MTNHTILIADDDTGVIAALQMLLKSNGFDVIAVTSPEALLSHLKSAPISLALIDLNYQNDTTSGNEGLALISDIKALDHNLPVVVMTGYSSVDVAVQAMKLGAVDFIQKPWGNERLLQIIRTHIELANAQVRSHKLAGEVAILKNQVAHATPSMIAQSNVMLEFMHKIEKLALSDMSILLTGENGTGKSLFAEYIHQHSGRKDQAFIAVNMGAITESLFESEMFGHVKGAFTDAKENRIGRFELAQGGTIFLDEIANIGLGQQAKLLRVLEERKFEKVGSNKTLNVDLRLISATNSDISELIKSNDFRQDLFYRLNTVTLHVPALRERQDDIVPLAQHFLNKFALKYRINAGRISEAAQQALCDYTWPGNIRELGHVIERALFLRSKDTIECKDLALDPAYTSSTAAKNEALDDINWDADNLDIIEQRVIEDRMKAFQGNPAKTAESLGLSRSAYYRRLEKYNLL